MYTTDVVHLALALALLQDSPDALLARAKAALASGEGAKVEALFSDSQTAGYLLEMAQRGGGLKNLGIAIIPAPPGWEYTGRYWATFYRPQVIEQDHDTVYPLLDTPEGYKLGPEVPEWETDLQIRIADTSVHLQPDKRRVDVKSVIEFDPTLKWKDTLRAGMVVPILRNPVVRLNSNYKLEEASGTLRIVGSDEVPKDLAPGDIVRAGSLIIPWGGSSRLRLGYSATLNAKSGDRVDDKVAYLTAWWVPNIARLQKQSFVHIVGPKDWVLRSEGVPLEPRKEVVSGATLMPRFKPGPTEKAVSFASIVPISYPKVIAGEYKVAATLKRGRHTFTSLQLEPLDVARGKQIVERAARGMEFFEKNLYRFPYAGYEVFDSKDFYGIESYSHTLLDKSISLRYATHEMGHTYFGGMVPCPYVRDTWNEGVTTYVDDILFLSNVEETLKSGLNTTRWNVPLDKMHVAYAYQGASYWRGAYVMRMLENEIGLKAVLAGLKDLIEERYSVDTAWADLRPHFEKSSRKDLSWFWKQWVEGSSFPKLELGPAQQTGKDLTVRLVQSGTPTPYRLRFKLTFFRAGKLASQVIVMDKASQSFTLSNAAAPVKLEVLGYTLATQ